MRPRVWTNSSLDGLLAEEVTHGRPVVLEEGRGSACSSNGVQAAKESGGLMNGSSPRKWVSCTYLLNSIEILEVRSFHINPAGYIVELGISVGTPAFSGLNFVQIRHCKGGMSP